MPHPSLVIGIAGGSGSGKSWFAQKLHDAFPVETTLIEQDWYYRDLSALSLEDASSVNFDHPDSIEFPLLLEQLQSLKNGTPVQAPGYRYSNYQRIENAHPLDPTPILVVEGLFTLQHAGLRELLDTKIFIETDSQIRFERRLLRDACQRGYTNRQIERSWHQKATPMFEQFVAPSADHADIVWNPLRDNAFENVFLDDLRSHLANNGNQDQ
ncbi:MAG: uridine kinase [Opitutaceae bacterium]|nr:uridine kinase [Opitutaceae bacterium]